MGRLFIAVGIFLYIPAVCAYVIDGDASDWGINLYDSGADTMGYLNTHLPSGGLDIDVVTEDNTDASYGWKKVYPGWSYKNKFDAEAMYFDNDAHNAYIAIITGLPKSGSNPPGNAVNGNDDYAFKPGDIGIDTDGDGVYEFGVKVTTKKLYSGLTDDNWEGVYYSSFSEASPWRIKNKTSDTLIDFFYSSVQNTHYVLEAAIPLSLLGLSANAEDPIIPLTIHWTMECGNDYLNLEADVNPVPEPATIVMVGVGLLSFLGLRLKRKV